MIVAALTKPVVAGNEERKTILDSLKMESSFSVREYSDFSKIERGADVIIAFGGDGTVLDAAVKGVEYSIPILGINLGNMGFLSGFERTVDPKDVIAALKSGKITRRALLSCNAQGREFIALNDAVLKSAAARPVHIDLTIDGEYVDSYHSDGIIVSTPTGSTAYSLSAGGPVLSPDVDATLVIPVCPHSLHSRPLVISSSSRIELRVSDEDGALFVVDGHRAMMLEGPSSVIITKAKSNLAFIDTGQDGFYKKLLVKMNRWGTTEF